MVWDASKAFTRGYLIQPNSEFKCKSQGKTQYILDEIKRNKELKNS